MISFAQNVTFEMGHICNIDDMYFTYYNIENLSKIQGSFQNETNTRAHCINLVRICVEDIIIHPRRYNTQINLNRLINLRQQLIQMKDYISEDKIDPD